MIRRPPRSTLFPNATLFRSNRFAERARTAVAGAAEGGVTAKDYVARTTRRSARRGDRTVVADRGGAVPEIVGGQLGDHLAAALGGAVPGGQAGAVHGRGEDLAAGERPVRGQRDVQDRAVLEPAGGGQ